MDNVDPSADSDPVVLVTGAGGYLASHVISRLQEEGYRVKGTMRDVKNVEKIDQLHQLCPQAKHKLEIVEAELCDPESWVEAVKGCTYVHHIATPMPLESPKDEKKVILEPSVDGTTNVLKACQASGTVKRVVLTSSLFAVSCKGDNETPFTESDWLDDKMSGLPTYPKNKVLQERAAWDFVKGLADKANFELVVINPGFLMGPLLLPYLCNSANVLLRFLDGRMPMVPKFNFNLCDVRDAAIAHVKAMTLEGVAGNRHIVVGGTMWMKEWGEVLSKELADQGYSIPTKEIPNIFISVAAKIDKDLTKVKFIASTPIKVDNSRQTNVLKLEARPKDQCLIDMVHSMIEMGLAKRTDKYKARTA